MPFPSMPVKGVMSTACTGAASQYCAGLSRLSFVALRMSRLYVFAALSKSSFSGVRVPATSRLSVCGVA